jgi:hypothetical protein
MASGANAFNSRAGFNQSGGAHFMSLAALSGATNADSNAVSPFVSVLVNGGSNSGGAFVNPTFARASATTIFAPTSGAAGSFAAAVMNTQNLLLKDMGKTVVSSGRTFRKFAPVVNNSNAISTFGVVGSAGVAPNVGYATFYLEVAREGLAGAQANSPAPIVRYF